jgi:hypothetical protein
MFKLFITFLLCSCAFCIKGQTVSLPAKTTQAFGVIDTADLKMTSCDFEKDANAMVLFDKAEVYYKYSSIVMERHKRIKIFNDNGKDEANIRIDYYGAHRDEVVTEVEAETINLNNKSIEFTPVDKKLIYTEVTDKNKKAIIFTFPGVKTGSVIEFKYKLTTPYPYNYPDWIFQSSIPCRYSEFNAGFNDKFWLNFFVKVYQPMLRDTSYVKESKHTWALSNINSYKIEPYMDYPEDYLQCILFKTFHFGRTWSKIGANMLEDEDFGEQLKKNLSKEDEIIANAKALKTDGEKIAYLFNTIKKTIKWNKEDYWFTIDGVKKAWDKKTGNSTEINLILYHLLKSADIKTSLLTLCTRDNGKLNPDYASTANFNKTVIYYPIDSTQYYILDASNPYNTYNNIPLDLVGLNALSIDPDEKKFSIFPIKNAVARQAVFVNGNIGADGKLEGMTQISASAYSRERYLKRYNDLGEKKYIENMQHEDNSLKITSLKLENIENDTLPLIQSLEFKYNLTEPDGDYMYFNPNLFTGFEANPFTSETRISNIDFGCMYNYSISGRYKIPSGYKVDGMPKPVSLQMPDKSVTFKRFTAEEDGIMVIHYTIDFKRSVFSKDEYPGIRDFYKKMYELLNEQIVLKKS